MDYIITDDGVRILEEEGLKKKIDENYGELVRRSLSYWCGNEMVGYISENRVHPEYAQEVLSGEGDSDQGKFLVFSYIMPNHLIEKEVIPQGLPDDLMTAVGVYFLTKREEDSRCRRNFSHRSKEYLTCINADIHGDFFLQQYNHASQPEATLYPTEKLFKKLTDADKGKLYGHYDYWIGFLEQLVMYCCQEGIDIPYKNNWGDIFYMGSMPSDEPGEVSRFSIDCLKDYPGLKECIPRLPGWEKQRDAKWMPLKGRIEESQGFISDGNLVYYHKNESGDTEFAHNRYKKANVVITPEFVIPLISGTVCLIRDGAGRGQPQDPGLVLKHFPYDFFHKGV